MSKIIELLQQVTTLIMLIVKTKKKGNECTCGCAHKQFDSDKNQELTEDGKI